MPPSNRHSGTRFDRLTCAVLLILCVGLIGRNASANHFEARCTQAVRALGTDAQLVGGPVRDLYSGQQATLTDGLNGYTCRRAGRTLQLTATSGEQWTAQP